MFSPTQHDQFLAQGLEPEVAARCTCCGAESTALDDLGRCPRPLCVLASQIDAEVPLALTRLVRRATTIAFDARRADGERALDAILDTATPDLTRLPWEGGVMSTLTYDLAREILADEIADAGAGCIARVARTASTPRAWRMISADLEHWQHPSCPAHWEKVLSKAARMMTWAQGGPAAAAALLDDHTGEPTVVVGLDVDVVRAAEAFA